MGGLPDNAEIPMRIIGNQVRPLQSPAASHGWLADGGNGIAERSEVK